MKQKWSLFALLLGFALLAISFIQRESHEKEMYKIYVDQQKENLVKGWDENWKEFLQNSVQPEFDEKGFFLNVDRSGKIISNFFPESSQKETQWFLYESLSDTKKREILHKVINSNNSWDRVIAIKRLVKKEALPKNIKLSPYEQTLVFDDAKRAFSLIFEQLENREIFRAIEKQTLDKVIVIPKGKGEITLYVPSKDYLINHSVFKKFKLQNGIDDIEISINPFKVVLKEKFNPLRIRSNRDKAIMLLGILLITLAGFLYFFDLNEKNKQVYKENKRLVFSIKDEGPGISKSDSEKIFNEFYRSKDAKDISPDGLGIGLSIVKNISLQMGSSVELKNPGSKGANFILRLSKNDLRKCYG